MTVRLELDVIHLSGPCRVEDAEPLVALLQQDRSRPVDLTDVSSLHTAIVQVLLCFRPSLTGHAGDPFFAKWLTPLFVHDTLNTGPA